MTVKALIIDPVNVYIGSVVRTTMTFTDVSGNLADPTTITFTVRSPKGVNTTPTATKTSTGIWWVEYTITASGQWVYRVITTGTPVVAYERGIQCPPSYVL